MAKKQKTAIVPTREDNYPQWYQQVIKAADLAENSEVRGCMVIKPWGYAIWENMQYVLDRMFKKSGVKNAYFPLFIPKSYFEKEAKHVEGFAKECAVVTHSRLEDDGKGGLVEAGKLTESYIVRPTSETIIGASFSKWVNSYRDLPLLINQWANVVRWELRPRLFLRTSEFLWQEGHTVHASHAEAMAKTMEMLEVYAKFCKEYLAIPVSKGRKTESERFPGAVDTLCIEAMMQDYKALQAGTTHYLGQNFAKASDIKYQNKDGEMELAYTTSWGVSTRLVGALIMAHSDDNGLVLPPKIAPTHVVFIPIYKTDEQKATVLEYINGITQQIEKLMYNKREINVEIDTRDMSGGERSWYWIKKGVPVRVEVGSRDMADNSVFIARRDQNPRDKKACNKDEFCTSLVDILTNIQDTIYARAVDFKNANTKEIDNEQEFKKFFTPQKQENHGGFAMSHWCGDTACEEKIKQDLKVTIRCIPFGDADTAGTCIYCGKESKGKVIFAKSY